MIKLTKKLLVKQYSVLSLLNNIPVLNKINKYFIIF